MRRLIKILLLFEIGLLVGIFIISPKTSPKVLPISSHLPELSFSEESPSAITFVFTGDVMLGRSVNTRIQKYADPTWPFKNIAAILSQSDLTIINLESPFVKDCQPTDQGMIFCSHPDNVAGLNFAGVDYASLANNHINNYGQAGIDDTVSTLSNHGIISLKNGLTELKTVKNTKIALISFSDLPQLNDDELVKQISMATQSADLVITTFHWGYEYQRNPNSRQIQLAHLAIDSGADIVVGHHPHWIQTEEIYQGKPIYYSLGNLVFDQMWSEETRNGEILKVTYQGKQLLKKEVTQIKIFDYGQPNIIISKE